MLRQGYKSETVLGNAATVTAARQASVMAKEITLREHLASIASKGGTARGEKQSAKCKQAIAKKGGKAGGKAAARPSAQPGGSKSQKRQRETMEE